MTANARQYDVIIVGAGSAGCILAARLSEAPNRSVLLIEAGPDYPDEALLPADLANGWSPTVSHDWGFASEPGTIYRLTAYSCTCRGFVEWGRCQHHGLLLARLGWLPEVEDDPEPEPPTPVVPCPSPT